MYGNHEGGLTLWTRDVLKEFSYGAQTSIIIVSNFQNFRPNISMVYWAFEQNQTVAQQKKRY